MELNMKEKKSITKKLAEKYKKISKKGKNNILNNFIEITGYNRDYASFLLRSHGKKIYLNNKIIFVGDISKKIKREKPKKYDVTVLSVLKKIWALCDFICDKRLVQILPEILSKLAKFIRTFADWKDKKPGFLEIDLVGHDGGNVSEDFAFTLNTTDVATGWCEVQAVKNRARIWTTEALESIKQRLPFKLLGIDSDNDSAFINNHMVQFCLNNQITFTRTRSNKKLVVK